jgi:hypothetical protein
MRPDGKKLFPFFWYWPNWLVGDGMEEIGLIDGLFWFIAIIVICGFWALAPLVL